MFVKLILFAGFTILLYFFGQPLDMIIFNRSCSSIYGVYAFLLTFVLLILFACLRKGLLPFLIYFGIPSTGLLTVVLTYAWLDKFLIEHASVILKSTICFYAFLFSGLVSIILAEKLNRP